MRFEQLIAKVAQTMDVYASGLAGEIRYTIKNEALLPQQRDYLMAVLYKGNNSMPRGLIRQYSEMFFGGNF